MPLVPEQGFAGVVSEGDLIPARLPFHSETLRRRRRRIGRITHSGYLSYE